MGAFTVVDDLAHDDHKFSDDEVEDEVLGGIEGDIAKEDNMVIHASWKHQLRSCTMVQSLRC
jgi:hypothetical protein